eukprot:6557257-Pyramimonas_sp.AAC.1
MAHDPRCIHNPRGQMGTRGGRGATSQECEAEMQTKEPYQEVFGVDLFAGHGQYSRCLREHGLRCESFEKDDGAHGD